MVAPSVAATALAIADERPVCPRCRAYLRDGQDDRDGLCDPCRDTVESCAPYVRPADPLIAVVAGPAPDGVNVLELAAGLLLIHDALHPGEPIYLRAALAAYGVTVDHTAVRHIVRKLARRHGLVAKGEARRTGHVLVDWTWELRRVKSSLAEA
jgi:hypothetical protein